MHVLPAYSGVYGEVVNALFALLYQRVLVHLPREVFHLTAYLFQCLVYGYGAYWHGAVAYYPFPCLVNVGTC